MIISIDHKNPIKMKKNNTVLCSVCAFIFFISTISGQEVLEWKFETENRIIAAPVIRNDSLFIGSLDGNLYVLNSLTGTELWHYSTYNEIRTTVALYEGIVCVESGNVLYGLGMDGSLLWTDTLYKGSLINEHDMWDVFRSSPSLLDSIAFIGSEEGWILGVNVKNGERVFEARTLQADATIETTPSIYNGKVYVGDWLGVLSVFDISTQTLLWQYDTKDDNTYGWVNSIVSQPLIYRDTLYFGGRNCNLYALNPETGDKFWMYHQPGNMWLFGGPVASGDVLYVGSSFQHVVYAFNPDQPEMFWETNVYGINYGYPVIHDDNVIVGTGSSDGIQSGGSLTIINKQSHEMVGRYNVPGWVETPLYQEGIIYFGSSDHNIYAINEENLINLPHPNSYIKDENAINLGEFENRGIITTSFYIYNDGYSDDSLIYSPYYDYVTVEPETGILEPSDSFEISVTIDLTGLSAGTKTLYIRFKSNKSLVPDLLLSKIIAFDIIDVSGIESTREYTNIFLGQPFPNPATRNVNLNYFLNTSCYIDARLLNSSGKEVAHLLSSILPAGANNLTINTSQYKDGIYLLIFGTDDTVITRKIMIIN